MNLKINEQSINIDLKQTLSWFFVHCSSKDIRETYTQYIFFTIGLKTGEDVSITLYFIFIIPKLVSFVFLAQAFIKLIKSS